LEMRCEAPRLGTRVGPFDNKIYSRRDRLA
jgi:hypothetical protein